MAIASSNIRELQPQTFKRVLGIDPGLQVTGYSVLEKVGQGAKLLEAGIISTKDSGSKLLQVRIAYARGVILLAAAQYKLSVTSYNPTRVKKTLTGSGRAGKLQVQWAIQRELGLAELPEPPDVADAMAIGLTHIHAISLEKPELL